MGSFYIGKLQFRCVSIHMVYGGHGPPRFKGPCQVMKRVNLNPYTTHILNSRFLNVLLGLGVMLKIHHPTQAPQQQI